MIMHKEPNPALTEGDAETAKEQIIRPNAYLPDTTFSIQKAWEILALPYITTH